MGTHDWRQPFQGWKEQRQDMTTSEVPTTRSLGSSLSPGPLQGRYLCRARAYPSTSCIQLPPIPTSTRRERYSAQVGIPRGISVLPSVTFSLSLCVPVLLLIRLLHCCYLYILAGPVASQSQVQDGMSRLFGCAVLVLLCWLQKWILGLCFASVAPLHSCPCHSLAAALPLGR